MSLETELTAILTTAAIAPITDRGFLRITGPDATRWLNGMVTNNIKDLAPGEGNYNFLLNAQGRIQGDCTIYREPGEGEPVFLLETDTAQRETIHALLDKFIIMDDVEMSKQSNFEFGISVEGTQAFHVLTKALLTPDDEQVLLSNLHYITREGNLPLLVLPPSHDSLAKYELWTDSDNSRNTLLTWLQAAGAMVISPAALEAYRILSGTPRYGTDIRNTDTARDLPQETAQTHALNFNKGCYLGQEIVERIHSRGQVHRTFARFELTGDLPTLPTPLTLDGKPVGELTSAALIPLASGPTLRALGYIRREAATATLTYPGGTARVLPTSTLSS